mmetsp:Transcript_13860/g.29908  ORF Transcript_13860/g.29908 Transcript_13860/m.29908 type:complete len:245 (-) Transcript_13860:862-1596(-)
MLLKGMTDAPNASTRGASASCFWAGTTALCPVVLPIPAGSMTNPSGVRCCDMGCCCCCCIPDGEGCACGFPALEAWGCCCCCCPGGSCDSGGTCGCWGCACGSGCGGGCTGACCDPCTLGNRPIPGRPGSGMLMPCMKPICGRPMGNGGSPSCGGRPGNPMPMPCACESPGMSPASGVCMLGMSPALSGPMALSNGLSPAAVFIIAATGFINVGFGNDAPAATATAAAPDVPGSEVGVAEAGCG